MQTLDHALTVLMFLAIGSLIGIFVHEFNFWRKR